jgi:hypothetical protein
MTDPAWIRSLPGWDRLRHLGRINRRLDDRFTFVVRALNHLRDMILGLPSTEDYQAIYKPMTAWFNTPVTSESVLAPTPGTADANAMSRFGRVHIESSKSISVVHFHYDHPAGSGSYGLELWRLREETMTLLATCVSSGSSGDFGTYNFVFPDPELREVLSGDYLFLQATSKMTGGAGKNAAGYVDIHFAESTLPLRFPTP